MLLQCGAGSSNSKGSSAPDLPVNGIVLPSSTLLDTDSSPFGFRQETALRERLRELLWKDDVTAK